jgi:hypothetical protein
LCSDGLSQFEESSGREAARTVILYAFDLIEHDGEDLRSPIPGPEGSAGAAAARDRGGILPNEHIAEDGLTVFAHACQLGVRGLPHSTTSAISHRIA